MSDVRIIIKHSDPGDPLPWAEGRIWPHDAALMFLCQGAQEVITPPSLVERPAAVSYPTGANGEYVAEDGE